MGVRAEIATHLRAEVGAIHKEAPESVALVYPSPYRVAMSSLGYQTIYRTINAIDGMAAHRAFLPDDVEAWRHSRRPLVTYESMRPVSDTEGSNWIIECARRDDPRPLYVLVWGTIEDVAQALHDDPSIKKKLRVYFIAGPNKKWSPAAYNYIEQNHPDLWIIENNSTYRGWFEGGDQSGDLGNRSFVETHIRGRGALGDYFMGHLGGVIKMGDTPSVTYMMGTPENPSQPGWGGRFVRAWKRPKRVFDRLTTSDDELETFGLLELVLPGPKGATASLVVDGQEFPAAYEGGGVHRFRFVPKSTKRWSYRTKSTGAELDGLEGAFTSVDPSPDAASRPSARHPHWWTDDPDRAFAEGPHLGAVTVNRWREEFLRDFARRMLRCQAPAFH